MKCQNCGEENKNGNYCIKCGSPLIYSNFNGLSKPPTVTMVLALISFACFFYLGLPATLLMVFSRDAFHMGDMDKFKRYDKYSKICSIIGIALFVAIFIIYLIFMFIVLMEGATRL